MSGLNKKHKKLKRVATFRKEDHGIEMGQAICAVAMTHGENPRLIAKEASDAAIFCINMRRGASKKYPALVEAREREKILRRTLERSVEDAQDRETRIMQSFADLDHLYDY
jgi:hypothetical protein